MSVSGLDQLASAAAVELRHVATAGTDTVVRRAELDRLRRRRRSARVIATAAAVAAVAVIAFAAGGLHRAAPLPPSAPSPTPSPTSSLLTLAADPFLAPVDISYFKVVRQDHLDPPRPSACLSDPRSWGATESGARTYTDRHHADLIINEFVLRYDDSASAHRALLNASHQLITCASPRDVAFASDPADIRTLSDGDSVGNGPSIAEYVAQRRKLFPTAQRTEGTETEYTVRAARAGNLLVVIEYSRLTNPQPNVLLTVAFRRAVEGSDMAVFSWCPKLAC